MSTETLQWDFLGRDRLSDVLERIARNTDKTNRALQKLGTEGAAAGRKLGEVEPHANRVHASLNRVSDGAAAALGKLKTFGIGAALALGTAAGGAVMMGVRTAAANENAAISFELMLGNAQKAKAFLAELQKFAAATPFDMPSLRDAASRLLAVGVNAKDVIPIMTRLGDATAGMGTGAEGIGRAVYALQQMRQSGRASLEDINQLTDAGIPALDALAAHYHKTVADVRKMITAGKVTADDVFGAIEKGEGPAFQRLKGMMDRQSTTLTGLWSTFKDNLEQSLATAFQPAIPALKNVLNFAANAIPAVMSGIQSFAARIRGIFAGSDVGERIFGALAKAGREIIPFARDALEHLLGVIERNKDGLEKFGNLLANDVIPILAFLTKGAIANLVAGMETLVRVVSFIGENFQAMKHNVGTVLSAIADYSLNYLGVILHAAEHAFGWIPGLGPKLRSAVGEFDKFANDVRDKLDGLTRPVLIPVYATYRGTNAAPVAQGSAGNIAARRLMASGGVIAAASGLTLPDVVRVGENGPEELLIGPDGRGRIRPNNQISNGGDSDVIGTLRVVHQAPDGRVIRTELLKLSRRGGFTSTAQLLPVGTA